MLELVNMFVNARPLCWRRALKFDLHCHSTASDGILSPAALVSRAKIHGVTHLALTDHDTVAGIAEAERAAATEGVTIIPGVEMSTQWCGIGIHILGLNVDIGNKAFAESLAYQRDARVARAEEIGKRLEKAGVPGAWQGAVALAGSEAAGRPHFAQYLVSEGYVKSINAAFKQYLGAGKLGDVKQVWLSLEEVVGAITGCGGEAVIAHPLKYKMTLSKLRQLVLAFSQCGGGAIEVISGAQTDSQTKSMVNLAARFSLLASCGSDFHAPGQGWQELGRYSELPQSCSPIWDMWPSLAAGYARE